MLWKRNVSLPVISYQYNLTVEVVSIRKITLMEWGVLGGLMTSPGCPLEELAKELGIPQIEFLNVIYRQLRLLDLVNESNEVTERGKDLFLRELMESDPLEDELEVQYLPDAQKWIMSNEFTSSINSYVIEDPGWSISNRELNLLIKEKNPKEWENREVRSIHVDQCVEMKLDWRFDINVVNYQPYISFQSNDKRDKKIDVETFNRFYTKNNQSTINDKIIDVLTKIEEDGNFMELDTQDRTAGLSSFLDRVDEIVEAKLITREINKGSSSIVLGQNLQLNVIMDPDRLTYCNINNNQLSIISKFTQKWEELFPDKELRVSMEVSESPSSIYILQGSTWVGFEWITFNYNEYSVPLIGKIPRASKLDLHEFILYSLKNLPDLQKHLLHWTLEKQKGSSIVEAILNDIMKMNNNLELLKIWKKLEMIEHGINLDWILQNFEKEYIIINSKKFKDILSEDELITILLEEQIVKLRKETNIEALINIVNTIIEVEEIDRENAIDVMQNHKEIGEILLEFVEKDQKDLIISNEILNEIFNLEEYLGRLYGNYLIKIGETISLDNLELQLEVFASLINHMYKHKSGTKLLERVIYIIFPVFSEGWLFEKLPDFTSYKVLIGDLDAILHNPTQNILVQKIHSKPIGKWNKKFRKKLEEKLDEFELLFQINSRAKKLGLQDLINSYPKCESIKDTNQWLETLELFNQSDLKNASSRDILLKCNLKSLNSKEIINRFKFLGLSQNQIDQHVKREQRKVSKSQTLQKSIPEKRTVIYVDGPNIARDQLGRNNTPDVSRFEILINQIESEFQLQVLIVISAKFWRDISDNQKSELEKLQTNKQLMTAPAFRSDDHFAIVSARNNNGYIMSNDAYRDWIAKDESLKDWLENHRITCAWNTIENNFTIGPNISKLTRRNKK